MKEKAREYMDYDAGAGEKQGWLIKENAYDYRYLSKCESIFCLGNGYMGLRSAHEEKYTGETRGMFVTGTFNKASEEEVTELPNLPDITNMEIVLDGESFSLDRGEIKGYERVMDLQTGELTRKVLWVSPAGMEYELRFRRIVSKVRENIIGARVEVTPLSGDAVVSIKSGINGRVTNSGAQHMSDGEKRLFKERFFEIISETTQSEVMVALHTAHRFFFEDKELSHSVHPIIDRRIVMGQREEKVSKGEVFAVEKISSVHTSRDLSFKSKKASKEDLREKAYADIQLAYEAGYDALYKESKDAWAQYWDRTDIKIDSKNSVDQVAIRFALYHLEIIVNGNDNRVGIGAKGMSGEGYKGHSFWDTEIFMFPFYLLTNPKIARTLLEYRYNTIQGAYNKAHENGYEGAMYPWESAWAEDGEVTPEMGGADVVTGEATPILTGKIEQHITADISYAVWQYYLTTEDDDFMEKCGFEILMQTGKFWLSRMQWSEKRQRYEINDVIGPDEYKEHVDNNAYTNYMAYFNMSKAIVAIDMISELPELNARLSKETDLVKLKSELEEKIGMLYLPEPNEKDLIPQFDGYFDLTDIDLTKYKNKVGSIGNDYNMEQVNTLMVSKQADVVLLFLLLEHLFPEEVKVKNYKFYEAHTLHDSSLSRATYSVLASDIGWKEEAYKLFSEASMTDLGQNMNSSEMGIHSACMGGTWQSVIYGFAGVRLVDGELRIEPKLPDEWNSIEFPIEFKGKRKMIKVSNSETDQVTIK